MSSHELTDFEECSIANSGIVWNDGYDRAKCSCGWVSAPCKGSDKHVALVRLFELHVKVALFEQGQVRTEATTVKAVVVEPKQLTCEKLQKLEQRRKKPR